MNKRQLFILWIALAIITSMVWFPGSWFGYIIDGYPLLKPGSMEFMVRALLPVVAFTLLLLYGLRDKKMPVTRQVQGVRPQGRRAARFVPLLLMLGVGLLCGFIVAYSMISRNDQPARVTPEDGIKNAAVDDGFRQFCRREGYRQEVEALTTWLEAEHASSIAIIYNEDDAYSSDLYRYFSQRLRDEKITIAVSDAFGEGETSFVGELKVLESARPEAIIFLGSHEDRIAFLETIAEQADADFWQQRVNKIRWIE